MNKPALDNSTTSAVLTTLAIFAMLFVSAASANAQEPVVSVPVTPSPVVDDSGQTGLNPQYDDDGIEDGLEDVSEDTDSGGQTTTQSIEEGLEDAVEGVETGEGGDAVAGTGAYLDSLSGGGQSSGAAAAETVESVEPTHEKPSEAYTALPDTGGVSPLVVASGVGAIVIATILFFGVRRWVRV